MSSIKEWIREITLHPWVEGMLNSPFHFLLPPFIHRVRDEDASLGMFAMVNIEGIAQVFVWYTILGWVMYAISVRWLGKVGAARFSYPLPVPEPGEKLSLLGGIKYVLPRSFYTHPSFKIDMMWLPFSMVLRFFGLLGTTLGAGIVQGWLLQRFGQSALAIPEGGFAIALQVIIMLLARDFARFMWHYQAHAIPFCWEFHKVHHSAEVLHPLGVRTHPVDMFLRNTYMGAGGGLIAGTLIYLLGMDFSLTGASLVSGALGIFGMLEHFEHSHVSISFGKRLDRFFYAPYMHHFHHGAALEHRDVNLGITGGLTLWDYLFGTLYWPKNGEKVVWGASLEELGGNNPHRTLWGLVWSPFVAAFRTLRRSPSADTRSPRAGRL